MVCEFILDLSSRLKICRVLPLRKARMDDTGFINAASAWMGLFVMAPPFFRSHRVTEPDSHATTQFSDCIVQLPNLMASGGTPREAS